MWGIFQVFPCSFDSELTEACFLCDIFRGALLRDALSIYSVKSDYCLFPKHITTEGEIFLIPLT